ncbi:MAG: hypothetical protein QXV81_09265 [Ignisphaera sp.]
MNYSVPGLAKWNCIKPLVRESEKLLQNRLEKRRTIEKQMVEKLDIRK